jgi:adenylate cyclase class IV
MLNYKGFQKEREPLVIGLSKLGYNTEEIRKILHCSTSTVQNDIKRLGILRIPEQCKFLAKLKKYAEMRFSKTEPLIQAVLGSDPEILSLRQFCENVVHYRLHLEDPRTKLPVSYHALYSAIFGDTQNRFSFSEKILHSFLDEIALGKIIENLHQAENSILELLENQTSRKNIVIACDVEKFEQALHTLGFWEKAVRLRYGVGNDIHTLRKIGKEYNLSHSRIDQAIAYSLLQLRKYFTTYDANDAVVTVNTIENKILELEASVDKTLESRRKALSCLYELPIDSTYLSVRTINSLMNANICTVGDLIQKPESDLLRQKGLGKKSVREIKIVLSELSPLLELGMLLST